MKRRDETSLALDDLTLKQEVVLRACIDTQVKDDYLRPEAITKMCDTFCSLNFDEDEPLYINKNEFNSAVKSLLGRGYLSFFSGCGLQTTKKGIAYVELQQKSYVENYDFDVISVLNNVAKEIQYIARQKPRKK
jgi:hypothetical protein